MSEGERDENMSHEDPDCGDWVLVWGQVKVAPPMTGVHPEDLVVEFFSHGEQYQAHVRADRVQTAPELPDFVERCTHLGSYPGLLDLDALYRCNKHLGHSEEHEAGAGLSWRSNKSIGYIEEA